METEIKFCPRCGAEIAHLTSGYVCPKCGWREGGSNDIIEIPFGASDSELKGWEYTIPEGMEAKIEDGKIIVREKDSIMIEEIFVSLETAKALQEKGFYALCYWYYILEGDEYVEPGELVHPSYGAREENPEIYVAAPSFGLVTRWLIQRHNILLVVDYEYECDSTPYYYKIYKLGKNGMPEQVAVTGVSYDKDNNPTEHIVGFRDYSRSKWEYATYEGAYEAGIKYCLENLI